MRISDWSSDVCSSDLIGHTLAVAVGLAAVFAASEAAFMVLKLAGALYLLYLAWGAFRAQGRAQGAAPAPKLAASALFRRGIIMNLTNPKVSLFFLAFRSEEHTSELQSLMRISYA